MKCWYTWIYPLVNKSDVLKKIKIFHKMIENLINHKIIIIQSDSRGEFLNNFFHKYMNDNGIAQRFLSPYTPE